MAMILTERAISDRCLQGLICPAYNASKAGVVQLAKNLASEWGQYGIRVNTISPGYIVTAMVEELFRLYPERRVDWPAQNMLNKLSKPEDFRGAAVFLLSPASSYMTGADLRIDGGHASWQRHLTSSDVGTPNQPYSPESSPVTFPTLTSLTIPCLPSALTTPPAKPNLFSISPSLIPLSSLMTSTSRIVLTCKNRFPPLSERLVLANSASASCCSLSLAFSTRRAGFCDSSGNICGCG